MCLVPSALRRAQAITPVSSPARSSMPIVTSTITGRGIMTRTSAGLLREIRLAMASIGMRIHGIIRSSLWILQACDPCLPLNGDLDRLSPDRSQCLLFLIPSNCPLPPFRESMLRGICQLRLGGDPPVLSDERIRYLFVTKSLRCKSKKW